MANELRVADETGLTYTCEVRQLDGTLIGSAVSLTESGTSGRYYGDMPVAAAGAYDLIYIQNSINEAVETLYWNGSKLLDLNDALTATGFSTFDHTSDEVTTDAASRTASRADISGLPSATDIATAVWSATTRTLTSAALSVADIWSYATRTLTGTVPANVTQVDGSAVSSADDFKADVSGLPTASEIVDAINGAAIEINVDSALSSTGDLTITKNETLSVTFSNLSISANTTLVYFTIQNNLRDADAEAIVQIVSGTGLVRLNGAAAATAGDGSVTVDQPNGTVAVALADDAIALIKARTVLHYDVKYITSLGTSGRLAQGRVIVQWTPTKAV